MGALATRQNARVEEAEVTSNHAYKYPPRSGNYFGSHFIMGGERFDTPQPEAYLFGENADLNFLGSRPTPFPYPPPQSNEPTKTLKSLVNIRKESLRFVRCPDPIGKIVEGPKDAKGSYYNIEFTFDSDAKVAITIYYFCTEELTPNGVVYYPRDQSMTSQTYHYKKGANQQFCQTAHYFDPSKYADEDLAFNPDKEVMPIAIYCQVEEGQDEVKQSHTTIAVVEKHTDGTYVLKALKQKLFVDGLCYLLQEIYGIENKNLDTKAQVEEEGEECGSECVICMCEARDTLILPCRHLCLCNSCADSLRYQANNCPICRAPFRALLQIRALQLTTNTQNNSHTNDGSMENIPVGYEPVSLIEALNGPRPIAAQMPIASPDTDSASQQAAELLNRNNMERSSSTSLSNVKKIKEEKTKDKVKANNAAPEFRMSVLLAREETKRSEDKVRSPLLEEHSAKFNGLENISKSATELNHCVDEEGESDGSGFESEPCPDNDDGAHDSDVERTSPLLTHSSNEIIIKCNGRNSADSDHHNKESPLRKDTSLTHVDTNNTHPVDNHQQSSDSDYFTPEDANTTILTVPKHFRLNESSNNVNSDCTVQRWALPHHVTSLPGTPLSQSSVRSSGDSYGSSSSTKRLLSRIEAQQPTDAC